MKIDIVGSGCTWTEGLSTSFIINDEILFDAPQGSFKTLLHRYDLSKINYIFLTHFHSDHFLDLHLVLEYIFNHYPDKKITILAPAGCCERLCGLFRILEVAYLEEVLKNRVTFITLENNKKYTLCSYKIKAFKMLHGSLDAYGFVINDNGVKVGFTGDTAMCNNVLKIIKAAKECFIDSANVIANNKHLSVGEVCALQKEFVSCRLHPIHLSDDSMNVLDSEGISYPKQGERILVE